MELSSNARMVLMALYELHRDGLISVETTNFVTPSYDDNSPEVTFEGVLTEDGINAAKHMMKGTN